MRKLDRTAVPPPPCLASYRPGRDNWNDVDAMDKKQIRDRLKQMQGQRCAYCEGPLEQLGQHIEHFRRKHLFPQLTFAWKNLYWSCNQNDSCGHYKDHGAGEYDLDELLEPCVDDPDTFFRFRSDGTIHVRHDLSPRDQQRARETLRVFNLHPEFGRLRNMRKTAATRYIGFVNELSALPPEERQEYVTLEVQSSAGEAFSTVIRHLFEGSE